MIVELSTLTLNFKISQKVEYIDLCTELNGSIISSIEDLFFVIMLVAIKRKTLATLRPCGYPSIKIETI